MAAGGEGYRGDDHDNEVGVGRDKKASGDRWDRSNDETDRDFGDGGDGKGTGDDGKGSGSRSMVHGRSEIRRALMWRSRWIYRDKRALPLEADELQVEVRERWSEEACMSSVPFGDVQREGACWFVGGGGGSHLTGPSMLNQVTRKFIRTPQAM